VVQRLTPLLGGANEDTQIALDVILTYVVVKSEWTQRFVKTVVVFLVHGADESVACIGHCLPDESKRFSQDVVKIVGDIAHILQLDDCLLDMRVTISQIRKCTGHIGHGFGTFASR